MPKPQRRSKILELLIFLDPWSMKYRTKAHVDTTTSSALLPSCAACRDTSDVPERCAKFRRYLSRVGNVGAESLLGYTGIIQRHGNKNKPARRSANPALGTLISRRGFRFTFDIAEGCGTWVMVMGNTVRSFKLFG